MNEPISTSQSAILPSEAARKNAKEGTIDISEIQSSVKISKDGVDSIVVFDLPKDIPALSPQIIRSAWKRQKSQTINQQDHQPQMDKKPQMQPQERKQEPPKVSSSRQHIQYSHSYYHQLHHHHHQHQVHNGFIDTQSDKKQKRNRRFSYSKVGTISSQEQQIEQTLSQEPQYNQQHQCSKGEVVAGSCSTPKGANGNLSNNNNNNNNNNGSWGHLVDPALKCCNIRTPNPPLKVVTSCSNSLSRGNGPWGKSPLKKGGETEESSPSMAYASPAQQLSSESASSGANEQEFLHDLPTFTPHYEQFNRPRVCKMLLKHPVVKLVWRVPEPIKAGGETLRGVLIISAKEPLESEIKASVSKRSRKKNSNKNVFIEHIEIDLTGVEEVTSGSGLLSRTRTDHHCFLHKTQVLPVEELKWINNSSSSGSGSVASPTVGTPNDALPLARMPTSMSTTSTIASHAASMPEFFQPGFIPLGTRQGIPFQMRVPEKVGGTFKSSYASINYHLTANVHVRYGNEVFVLQHPIPLCLFELVQIRAATKIASPQDHTPKYPESSQGPTKSVSFSKLSPTSSAVPSPTSSVRFVIPKASSVLGTAAVKPYSLWGLGPATSSQRHHYSYGNHHGYGRYHHHSSHNNQRNLTMHSTSSSTSLSATANGATGRTGNGMPRSQSASGALGSHQFYDEMNPAASDSHMLSAEDQYRQNNQQKLSKSGRRNSFKDNGDGLDEVGFGAHIDKSVAAAGDSVTLDMFVVKSDLMRVVDIKVSLVETVQIFSLLDHDDSCNVISPIASRARIFEMTRGEAGESCQKSRSRRKLVDTHVVKIAKNYVPAQSEENHANGNHLKGYYEDFEDFRTAKSLSMYKLSMRIPENALTILDRELLQVEYMFVIKFFFKGRMGAFLEVPIEIISQYNHNRISTISGAISCVSNSVQIALPPVPILTKRVENDSPTQPSAGEEAPSNNPQDFNNSQPVSNSEISSKELQEEEDCLEPPTVGGVDEEVGYEDSDEYSSKGGITYSNLSDVATTGEDSEQISLKSNSTDSDDLCQFVENMATTTKNVKKPKVISAQLSVLNKNEVTEQTKAAKAAIKEREKEKERILATSRLSRKESDAGKSNVARLTAVLMSSMDSTETNTKELTRTRSNGGTVSSALKSRALAFEGEGIPKIVTDKSCNGGKRSTTASPISASLSRKSPVYTESPSAMTPTSGTQNLSSTNNKATAASPALPLLFDLTSAALPSPSHPSVPVPNLSANVSNHQRFNGSSHGSESSAAGSIKSFSCKDLEATHQYQPSHLRQNTSSSNSCSGSSKEDEGISSSSSSSSSSSHTHHNGFVAKLAKSLSSTPLLRSRAASHGGVSPNGSTTNLSTYSSNQQQYSAFTLAATTLSALTLLPSVGHSASNNSNGHGHRGSSQQVLSTTSQPLKSCLKNRRLSEPVMTGLSIPITVDSSFLRSSPSPAPISSSPQQQFQQFQQLGIRKKVTFAKGSTPQPSPTASQTCLQDPDQYVFGGGRMNQPFLQSSTPSGNIGVNFTADYVQAMTMATPHPLSTSFPGQFQNINVAGGGMNYSGPPMIGTTSAAVAAGAVSRSPNSASPRSRLHHPFESHPSRLSPLEKQKLDFHMRGGQTNTRGINQNGGASASGSGNSDKGIDVSQHPQQRQHDDDDEDDECDYEEEEEELEYDEEDEEEDEEDDDRESEEERVERRRQARVAWLAKYGDAFKQVYGAVPELPPI